MPRRDGTGPMGVAQQTGWGNGYCRDPQGFDHTLQAAGRGFGRGLGRRRGFGGGMGQGRMAGWRGPLAAMDTEDLKHHLEQERDALQTQLSSLNERIEEMTAQQTQTT